MPDSWGKRTSGLVELIDVFPTVAALAGLPAPDGVDGTDQSALVASPASSGPEAAYHQYGFCFFFFGFNYPLHTRRTQYTIGDANPNSTREFVKSNSFPSFRHSVFSSA